VRKLRNISREVHQAIDGAQPRWVKVYVCVIGVPAWLYLFFQAVSADGDFKFDSWFDQVAVGAFAIAVVLQMLSLFHASWRHEL
jgi:hypothetical protein